MYAAVINEYNSSGIFNIIKLPSKELAEKQIRVEIKAGSVNPIDCRIRKGEYKYVTGRKFPLILGSDFSGVVLESRSNQFKPGHEVYGMVDPFLGGAYADEIIVDEENLGLKPSNLSFPEAASLPYVGLTAAEALLRQGKISENKQVLINGCTGGVGTLAIQLARIHTDKITAICSTRNIGFAESLGISNIVNYEKEPVTHKKKYDIIYDTIGNLNYAKIKSMLTTEGVFITNALKFRVYLQGLLNKRCKRIMVVPDKKLLGLITCLIDQDMLFPMVEETYSWRDLAQAHEHVEKGKVNGKIAIEMD